MKAKAVATGEQHGIGKRTVERALAKVEGRPKKERKPKTYAVPDDIAAIPDDNRYARPVVRPLKAGPSPVPH